MFDIVNRFLSIQFANIWKKYCNDIKFKSDEENEIFLNMIWYKNEVILMTKQLFYKII